MKLTKSYPESYASFDRKNGEIYICPNVSKKDAIDGLEYMKGRLDPNYGENEKDYIVVKTKIVPKEKGRWIIHVTEVGEK